MQAQVQQARGELLFEVQGKNVGNTIKEITPMGVRIEANNTGQVTGKYNANHMGTVNIFQKTDGTSEWESKGVQSTRDGDFVVIAGKGTGRPTSPTSSEYEGELYFMTQSPKLSWLNNTKARIEGTSDMAAGTFQTRIYSQK